MRILLLVITLTGCASSSQQVCETCAECDCDCPPAEAPREPPTAGAAAAEPLAFGTEEIQLAPPDREGGVLLMKALSLRHSTREFSDKGLTARQVSNLLWAAYGQNREDGKRTAPSAHNRQEIDVYVITADGLYLYDAAEHRLARTKQGDLRGLSGTQAYVTNAPINLVYVSDFERMMGRSDEERFQATSATAGFISQNVYLYCASAGLATVVRGSVDRPVLRAAMGLRPRQHIIWAQTVGYAEP